jgi:hypothetical protein
VRRKLLFRPAPIRYKKGKQRQAETFRVRKEPRYPLLYQVNTRAWLTAIGRELGRRATLDDIPDARIEELAALGFDWVWLLGVWRTGEASRRVSRSRPDWLAEYRQVLPDVTDDDILGSCFAIAGYDVHPLLGGQAALERLRQRLARQGLLLMLDFVPNHVALDHPWIAEHPDWFIRGDEDKLGREPFNWCRIVGPAGSSVFAYGRDPYFPGWPDTLQLNYGNPELQAAMRAELLRIAERCDGVRCDMAMLVVPDVFHRTWHIDAPAFWPDAIAAVRAVHPQFRLMAEVYWDMEWTLQQQGFDYTYDKRLYDRLRAGDPSAVRQHLVAGLDFQNRLVRFLENHDEPRAAAVFPPPVHHAAAVVTMLVPGLKLIQQGQMSGRRCRLPTHLVRWPDEPVDHELRAFYERLLEVMRRPVLRDGAWARLEPRAAWEGNASWQGFIAYAWRGANSRLVAASNYAATEGQCYLRLPFPELAAQRVRLRDLMSDAEYVREGAALTGPGLYLDLPPWGYNVFALEDVG